ncbi:hypothetical protein CLF_103858, partial [Clonorchis sinensis]
MGTTLLFIFERTDGPNCHTDNQRQDYAIFGNRGHFILSVQLVCHSRIPGLIQDQ